MSLFKEVGGKINDTTAVIARVDATTHAFETISYEHHEVHGGSHYFIEDFATIGNNVTTVFTVTTPQSSTQAHMLFQFDTTVGAQLDFFEGADNSGGTVLTPINNRRDSASTSILTITQNATSTTSSGTRLGGFAWGTNNRGGMIDRVDELILDKSQVYRFRLTSNGAGNVVSFKSTWYEHADKSPQ